jgi:hypothetical protein
VAEVVALVEQRAAGHLGQRVGETVAEVQLRRVARAAAEVAVGGARDLRLLGGERLDDEAAPRDEVVEQPHRDGVPASVCDDSGLDVRRSTNARIGHRAECVGVQVGVRLVADDRDER